MTQTELNYAKVLYGLSVPEQQVRDSEQILKEVPALLAVLSDPTAERKKKHALIERIFPEELHRFLKKAVDCGRAAALPGIFEAWREYAGRQKNELSAVLYYVTPPTGEQREGFVRFLKNQYGCESVSLKLVQERSLLGGFILRVGSTEYDYSLRGRLDGLRRQIIRR